MSTPFMTEIKIVSFNFAPSGWALCNGQLLPINQNQALFALLGTTYGGDGRVNFALPNLQGRLAIHTGQGHTLGERGGEYAHTLIMSEMPAHVHAVNASGKNADDQTPLGEYFAVAGSNIYVNGSGNTPLHPLTITNTGGSQPHTNQQPYLVLNFIIALQGIFPSQN